MKVAIFDFDGTIYEHETFGLLMKHMENHPLYKAKYPAFYRSIVVPYVSYKMKLYPEAKMKYNLMKKYLRIFEGISMENVENYFREVADTMREDFHPLVVERLLEHHHNGDYVMVVSGAFQPLLDHTLRELPIDTIIGTKIPSKENYFDSGQNIDHIQNERKSEVIREKLGNIQVDWENSYAYGDSFADLPVLEMVGNPVVVCPDEKLQAIANKKSWYIIC